MHELYISGIIDIKCIVDSSYICSSQTSVMQNSGHIRRGNRTLQADTGGETWLYLEFRTIAFTKADFCPKRWC